MNKFIIYLLLFITNPLICNSDYSNYYFSKDEYEHYMKLANEINPEAYEKLKECQAAIGKECIGKSWLKSEVFSSEKTLGYPVILLQSLSNYSEQEQKDILGEYLDWYNSLKRVPPITSQEQMKIMEIIKSIDPTAYEAIVSVDPTGSHIQRDYGGYGAFTFPSEADGLPVICIEDYVTSLPYNELRFLIAHELAHYVLGHSTELYKSSYQSAADEELLANAFSRVQENEADRIAIVDFGMDIDSAIAFEQRILLLNKENELKMPHKETFYRTHPLGIARIQHLESLRRDIEIHRNQRKHFNWRELAQGYLDSYWD